MFITFSLSFNANLSATFLEKPLKQWFKKGSIDPILRIRIMWSDDLHVKGYVWRFEATKVIKMLKIAGRIAFQVFLFQNCTAHWMDPKKRKREIPILVRVLQMFKCVNSSCITWLLKSTTIYLCNTPSDYNAHKWTSKGNWNYSHHSV